MTQSDTALFDRWRSHSDADAFAELLSRHASMVYGACLRVVRNPGIAEEVSQECFLELMKGPRGVRCIGAWLHTVATRRALDRLKAEGRRSERERSYAAARDAAAETDWDDTREFVDEAITALPEELRLPIVLRFLEGRTHEAIAEKLAVSRSTVRSRIETGIGAVRENLVKRGVVLSVAALSTALETLPASAAPPALLSELGRRALAMRSTPTLFSAAAGLKYAAAPLLLAGVVLAGAWAATRNTRPPESPAEIAAPENTLAAAVTPEPPDIPESPAVATGIPEADDKTSESAVVEPEPQPVAEGDAATDGWKLDLTPSEALKESLQKPTQVEFEDIHIKDVAELLQDKYDLNIVLDQRVIAPEIEKHVNKAFAPPSAESTTLEPAPEENSTSQIVRLPRRYITDGHIRTVNQKDKSVEEILTIITSPLNLTLKTRGNAIWISSSAQFTQDMTIPPPSALFDEGKIIKTLSSPVNLEFEDIHISDILGFLRECYKANFNLDTRVVMPQTKADSAELPDTSQFATDGMIDYINLKDASLAEALFVMTRMLNLTYRVD